MSKVEYLTNILNDHYPYSVKCEAIRELEEIGTAGAITSIIVVINRSEESAVIERAKQSLLALLTKVPSEVFAEGYKNYILQQG